MPFPKQVIVRMSQGTAVMAALFFAAPLAAQSQLCGAADAPCAVEDGTYHLLSPDTGAPKGIVLHLHGGGGTGKGMLGSGLAQAAIERGYIFVAPTGWHPGARFERNWAVKARGTDYERDDTAFLKNVLSDVQTRLDAADLPVMLAGFSRGASMVWDVACAEPDFAMAYAPVAGAFWDDLPGECAGPVNLYLTYGWNDRTVPLEGRSLRGGTVIQGDVWASLFILRATNGCTARQPESSSYEGDLWLRHWTDCDAGEIQLMLHKGGHGAPKGWAGAMMDWFEGLSPS
ncbi:polyhydroxybutyrate depolymerase [Rhodobacteraceae bacterium]|nr:polyhydroxybutyrate depolymerase [Paracoccaceae bacterium]